MGPGTTDFTNIFTETINRLDALVQPSVIDRDLTAPPGSPTNGDRYIPAATATGDWATHEDEIATYWDGWLFTIAVDGFRFFVEDEHAVIAYDGTIWRTMEALISIADDNVAEVVAPDTFGMISIVPAIPAGAGHMSFETAGATTSLAGGGADFEVTTGILAGGGGADLKFTASAHTDGKIYFSNRLGSTVEVRFKFLGAP